MEIKTKKVIEVSEGYLCDICGDKVVQDGQDICLINWDKKSVKEPVGYARHTHSSCVIRLIDSYGIKK